VCVCVCEVVCVCGKFGTLSSKFELCCLSAFVENMFVFMSCQRREFSHTFSSNYCVYSAKWAKIPSDTDILLVHGPPFGIHDLCTSGKRAGCPDLRREIEERIRPKVCVCVSICVCWLVGWLVDWLCLVALVGWLVGWLVCVGWLVGWLVGFNSHYKKVVVFGHIHEAAGYSKAECENGDEIVYINASSCALSFQVDNHPVVFDILKP